MLRVHRRMKWDPSGLSYPTRNLPFHQFRSRWTSGVWIHLFSGVCECYTQWSPCSRCVRWGDLAALSVVHTASTLFLVGQIIFWSSSATMINKCRYCIIQGASACKVWKFWNHQFYLNRRIFGDFIAIVIQKKKTWKSSFRP